MPQPIIPGFGQPVTVGSSQLKLPVYVSQNGTRPLIILHELPGMSPSFIKYCSEMADKGFKVYMPLMFKSPNTQMSNLQTGLFCLTWEFKKLFRARGSERHARPFTAWLIELVDFVGANNPDAKIGVVGMCLTGSFAIAAIAAPNVNAAVVCQPSHPFFFGIKTLGLSNSQRTNAADRAQTLTRPCAKGYRFKDDHISRESHMSAVQDLMRDTFERHPDLPGKNHSTLTTDSRSEVVFEDVLQYLNSRL